MGERQWAASVAQLLAKRLATYSDSIEVVPSSDLAYAHEVTSYDGATPSKAVTVQYETDILLRQRLQGGEWKPRVVIETKLAKVTTHDAITYSEKASTHKHVHPFLRYGILLGARGHFPLPGRLFRHGAYFAFMLSWSGEEPTAEELRLTSDLLQEELDASAQLEHVIYESRSPGRKRFTLLQRKLILA